MIDSGISQISLMYQLLSISQSIIKWVGNATDVSCADPENAKMDERR